MHRRDCPTAVTDEIGAANFTQRRLIRAITSEWRSACGRLRKLLTPIFLLCIASDVLPADSPWRWTVDVLPGSQFSTSKEAEGALRALGGKYALAEVVEQVNSTETHVTYTYGAKPRGPEIGPWYEYSMQFALTNPHPTEEAAIASVIAWGDQNRQSCTGATVVTPINAWRSWKNWYSGDAYEETRSYSVTYDVYPACDRQTASSQAWRKRNVACPVHMAWSSTSNACELRNIAKITGEIRPPSRCDKVGNPCSTGDGAKSLHEVDLELGWIRLERNYQSDTYVPYAGLGKHWSHSFSVRMLTSGSGAAQGVLTDTGEQLPVRSSSGVTIDGSGDIVVSGAPGQKKWLRTNGSSRTFNVVGRLIRDDRTDGHSNTYSYDALGRLTAVTHVSGRSLQFTYYPEPGSASSRIKEITSAGVVLVSYEYDANDNLVLVGYADGTSRQYHYGDTDYPHNLTGVTDEAGNRFATYAYDDLGRVTESQHAGGAGRVTLSFELDGSTVVTDALGSISTYRFSNDGYYRKPVSITSEAGAKVWTFPTPAVDFSRRPTQVVDRNGVVTKYEYLTYTDASLGGSIVRTRTIEAFGTARQRVSDIHRQYLTGLAVKFEQGGRSTRLTYNARRQVVTMVVTDAAINLTRTTARTYCETVDVPAGCPWVGLLRSIDGPRTDVSDVTMFGYDAQGNLASVSNALGHTTTYNSYNAHGQPLTISDPNGVVTTLTYDLRQRLKTRTAGNEQTSFDYWATGLIKKVTLADGSYLEYTYDAAHRLTDIDDSEGNRIHYTLDAMGNRTAEEVFDPSNALTQTRTRVFNALNQLHKDIGAAGDANVTTTYGYDNNSNQTSIAAPLGRISANGYDELNRLTTITDPAAGLAQYGYNALDQLISVTDPRGKVTTYSYNALGDLKQQVSPDTSTTTHTYDSAGNLATSTDARSKTATYGYDALNRVTSTTYPDQSISFTYDTGSNQKGRLTQATDHSGATSWLYDPHGRVTNRTQTIGGISKSVGYAYDLAGRLETLTLPSGAFVSYGYANGKVTSLTLNGATTILANALYQPFGPTTGWTWGNGTFAVREFDQDGKISDIDSGGLRSYLYDDAFRITGITDASDPNLSRGYGYDLLDRLTSATGTSLSQSWTYDANGNRLTQGGSAASTYTVWTTSNRLSAVSGALTKSYGYDAAGNITSDGSATFAYNDVGRMASATKAGLTTTYAHNALGQRVRKSSGGSSTYFVYDEAGHLLGEYDNAGNLIQETIWFDDIPVAVLKPSGSGGVNHFYLHTDHLNTPRRISRPSDNAIIWKWDSDPFGSTPANEDPDGDSTLFVYNLRFPGQYYDSETGLHYNDQRDGYDPPTGRYVQSDPIGLQGGINTYLYADANPVSFIDPLGLAPGDIFDSEAAARQDRALYAPLIDEHNSAWDVALFGEQLFLSDVYQVDCNQYTYDLIGFVTGYPPGVSKKPGKLGQFKGRNALRRENNIARDAVKRAGLNKDQARQLHDEISGQGLSRQEILQRALDIAGK